MKHELNRGEVIDFIEARNRHHLGRKQLKVDVEHYQNYLDNNEMSEEQKADFMSALWTVIVAFVDLGYGVHPVQTDSAEVISLSTRHQREEHTSLELGETAHV
ncbi:MAG: hypothetical protein VXW43_05410 [Pseudomonadota bacterium]|nr:hypothetical protein [Pseudomonadota bacterium]